MTTFLSRMIAPALMLTAGIAHAQTQKEIEPVVPVGPAVVPTVPVPVGPAVQPVIPLENLRGVETVTLDTPKGPVVVVSWPTSGSALSNDTNLDFGKMDTDDNGYLTMAETKQAAPTSAAASRLNTRFDSMDMDDDDRLSTQEVLAWVHR